MPRPDWYFLQRFDNLTELRIGESVKRFWQWTETSAHESQVPCLPHLKKLEMHVWLSWSGEFILDLGLDSLRSLEWLFLGFHVWYRRAGRREKVGRWASRYITRLLEELNFVETFKGLAITGGDGADVLGLCADAFKNWTCNLEWLSVNCCDEFSSSRSVFRMSSIRCRLARLADSGFICVIASQGKTADAIVCCEE